MAFEWRCGEQRQCCLFLSSLNWMGGDQIVGFFGFVRIIGFQLTIRFSNYFFCFNTANDINIRNQLSVDNLVFLKGRAPQLIGIQKKGNGKCKSESVDKRLDFRMWGADFIPGTETGILREPMHFAVVQVSTLINGADDTHKSCVCMLGLFIKSLELQLDLVG